MSMSAPAEPDKKSGWDKLSQDEKDARIEKMQAGRKRRGESAEDITVLKLQIKELQEQLKKQPEPRTAPAHVEARDTKDRCYYQFTRTMRTGPETIESLDDPRWAELRDFKRDVFGTFIVKYADGRPDTCLNRGPVPGREMMERFSLTGEHVLRIERGESK